MPKKADKTWELVTVHAWCTQEGCESTWEAEGSTWPMATASRHAATTGHVTKAESHAAVTYSKPVTS